MLLQSPDGGLSSLCPDPDARDNPYVNVELSNIEMA